MNKISELRKEAIALVEHLLQLWETMIKTRNFLRHVNEEMVEVADKAQQCINTLKGLGDKMVTDLPIYPNIILVEGYSVRDFLLNPTVTEETFKKMKISVREWKEKLR